MATMVKLQTVTVGSGGASSIDFTNIPQTYTDLKIVLSARTDRASANQDGLLVRLNGSTTGYSYRNIIGDGSAASASNAATATALRATASTATASVFSNGEYYLLNYTSANYKPYATNNVLENNATATTLNLYAGLWSNTAAVTSISIVSENSANFVQYTTATLYGVKNVTTATGTGKATGGNQVYTDGTYWYHVFTSSGTFTPLTSLTADYLVVAGAGGGGGPGVSGGGGGGAGGVRCTVGATGGGGSLESPLSLTAQAYTVTVGAGGAADTIGNNSVFGSITSTAGGRGKSSGSAANANGGSGGGGNGTAAGISANIAGTGTANQGYAGGDGFPGPGDNARNSGGGGGAGSVGAAGTASVGGNGGSGITTSISGTSTVYAGGGGGGVGYGTRGTGTDGGGNGGNGTTAGVAGTANRGAGGGGGGRNESTGTTQSPGAGGSGIVIVRYAA